VSNLTSEWFHLLPPFLSGGALSLILVNLCSGGITIDRSLWAITAVVGSFRAGKISLPHYSSRWIQWINLL